MSAAERRICDYLWFGFLPSERAACRCHDRYKAIADDPAMEVFDPSNTASMKTLLCKIVSEQLEGADEVALPLSAGFDSRALLGALLECLPARRIHSYTLGQPSTEDFALVRGRTRHLTPNHRLVDVAPLETWNVEGLVSAVTERPFGTVLGVGEFPPLQATVLHDLASLPQFSGFFGDTASGKKLPSPLSGRWREALIRFVSRNRAHKGDWSLLPDWYDPTESLPAEPFRPHPLITLDDQLDWCFRQEQRVKAFVGFRCDGSEDGNHRHPFYDPRWIKSFLQADTKRRIGQKLYKAFLVKEFPRIFADLGSPRRLVRAARKLGSMLVSPRQYERMHVDMDALFQANRSFRILVETCIEDLRKRDVCPWVPYEELLSAARAGHGRTGRLLYALTSLELNFKAGRMP